MIVKCRINANKKHKILSIEKDNTYSYIGKACLWIDDEKLDGEIIDHWLIDLDKMSPWCEHWYIVDTFIESDEYKQFKRQLKLERIIK